MTPFEEGFFLKCAESGLPPEDAGALLKAALGPVTESALSRAAMGAGIGGVLGGGLGALHNVFSKGPIVGYDAEGNPVHEESLKGSMLEDVLSGAGGGMTSGGLLGGAYGLGLGLGQEGAS